MVPVSPVVPRAGSVRLLEGDRLVLAGVTAEHEVRVAPGGLGGLHLEGVVIVALERNEVEVTVTFNKDYLE